MARIRKPFERPENKHDARLIIIATEGRKTERIYFEGLAKAYDSKNLHVEVLNRLSNNSSPSEVLNELSDFAEKYQIDQNDQLWMVIDRDYQSWTEKMIKSVARICHQKKGFFLGLSNPAFELWLILHFVSPNDLSKQEHARLFANKKEGTRRPYCKRRLSDLTGGFNESNYPPEKFLPLINEAIRNAKTLDINPKTRWPNYLGTRIYRLVEIIIQSKVN